MLLSRDLEMCWPVRASVVMTGPVPLPVDLMKFRSAINPSDDMNR